MTAIFDMISIPPQLLQIGAGWHKREEKFSINFKNQKKLMKKKKFNFTYERIKRSKSEGTRWMIPKVKVTGKFFHPALKKLVGLENEENVNSINKQNL